MVQNSPNPSFSNSFSSSSIVEAQAIDLGCTSALSAPINIEIAPQITLSLPIQQLEIHYAQAILLYLQLHRQAWPLTLLQI